ncbi:hypothetical protein H8S20_08115 [Clostridium sp. NSJ-6]|uniref:Uncharacterized protein n=1 Tax=Clostridium hominis TaxID=2763036 RepID=A0ABR7DDS3_9CLOT|nr:hypothetical protein [Clostridium hominis]MBC5628853.1 hypothetical protein [Clostridium hominis]
MGRLRVTIEFNPDRREELELYNELIKYSKPSMYIKDVLRGLSPIPFRYISSNLISIYSRGEEK